MDKPKITAIVPWFGGKRTLAKDIVCELGNHKQYFEPFCGSFAVILSKPMSPQETVSDMHFDVMNLARVIQIEDTAIELYQRLQYALPSEQLVLDARDFLAEDPQLQDMVERAFYYFSAFWLMRNGVSGMARTSFQIAVRWTPGGGSPCKQFESARESIPAWHRRLQGVLMLKRDAFRCLPRYDDTEKTAIYIDTPYVEEARSHGTYLHDFKDPSLFDCEQNPHERIRDEVARFEKARVVVSHYDCDRVRELYEGWTFIKKTRNKNLHKQNGRGSRQAEAPEVLIVNGLSYE